MVTEPEGRFAYNPALDGVRGIAALAVFVFHDGLTQGGLTWLSGGFLGVDIFFVLSGYLITTLLIMEQQRRGGVHLTRFWARRARRLLPALFVLLLGVSLYAATASRTDLLGDLRGQGFATLLYVQNWYLVVSDPHVVSPLSHTWSLSIEEQWYLIWPLVVIALGAVRSTARRWIVAALSCASAGAMAVTWAVGDTSLAFNGTHTRAFELLAGALLAYVLGGEPARGVWTRRSIGPAAGAVVIVALATSTIHGAPMFLGGRVVLVAAVAVVLAAVSGGRPTALSRVLSWRPLVAVGLVSYGVYLYHWPLFVWLTPSRVGFDGYALTAVRVLVTGLVAAGSYRFIEQPIRHGALTRLQAPVAVAAASAVTIVALLVTTAGATDAPTVTEIAFQRVARHVPRGAEPVLVVGGPTAVAMSGYRHAPISVDHIAGAVVASLVCDLTGTSAVVNSHVSAANPHCRARVDELASAARAYRPTAVVVLVEAAQLFDRQAPTGEIAVPGTAVATRWLERGLERTVHAVPPGAAVIIADAMPCPAAGTPTGLAIVTSDPARRAWMRSAIRRFAQRSHRVRVASMTDAWCASDRSSASPRPAWSWRWVAQVVASRS